MNKTITSIRSKKQHYQDYVEEWKSKGDYPTTRIAFDNYTRRWSSKAYPDRIIEDVIRTNGKNVEVWYFHKDNHICDSQFDGEYT